MRLSREGIFIVILIALAIGIYYMNMKGEGFTTADEAIADHADFVRTQQGTRNPVGVALVASDAQGALGTDTKAIFGTTSLVGSGTAIPKSTMTDPYPLNDGDSGLWEKIKRCEAVKTADPNAFNDPEFAEDCGVCFEVGTDASKKPKTGGMLVMEKDKEYARKYQKRGNRIPEYKPTFGSCPAGRLATSKQEALRIKKEIECKNTKDYNIPGCSQCYSDESFFPVDTAVVNESLLYVNGRGVMTIISPKGQQTKTLSQNEPGTSFEIFDADLKEGDTITIRVEEAPNATAAPIRVMLYGYLEGFTKKGKFQIDLKRLVQIDNVTRSKVRTRGVNTKSDPPTNILTPGAGQRKMELQVYIPFSFTDSDTVESDNCPDGPFVTKQSSAEFLGSDPCYKPGTGPGSYTAACLQGIFTSNGCTEKGKGFPKEQAAISALLFDSGGRARQLADIANYIYDQAIVGATGVSQAGQKVSRTQWSDASEFCFGNKITSPCDEPGNDVGPVSLDCMKYLWNNEGMNKATGATYNTLSSAQSLRPASNVPLFCTTEGTASPVLPNGQPNNVAIDMYRKLGGYENIRKKMREIHAQANDNSIPEASKADAIMQCYGKSPSAPPPPKGVTQAYCPPGCGPKARYVRFEARGTWIQLTQVTVRDLFGKNISLGKPTSMSSQYVGEANAFGKERAVNGDETSRGIGTPPYATVTNNRPQGDFWEIDLQAEYEIGSLTAFTRTDVAWERMGITDLILLNTSRNEVARRRFRGSDIWQTAIQTIYFTKQSEECLKCDSSTSEQVFGVGGPWYAFTRDEAPKVCAALGAAQATYSDVQKSQEEGADLCMSGWVSDSSIAIYPITGSLYQGCGNGTPGIKQMNPNPQWKTIGYEGNTVTVAPNTRVRYGKGNNWVERTESGTFRADNGRFGDPIYGVYKEIQSGETRAGVYCKGIKPTNGVPQDGNPVGRNFTVGNKTYKVMNFSPSSYNKPKGVPGGSIF